MKFYFRMNLLCNFSPPSVFPVYINVAKDFNGSSTYCIYCIFSGYIPSWPWWHWVCIILCLILATFHSFVYLPTLTTEIWAWLFKKVFFTNLALTLSHPSHFTYKYRPYSHRKPQDIAIAAVIQRLEIILPPCEFFGNYSSDETGPFSSTSSSVWGRDNMSHPNSSLFHVFRCVSMVDVVDYGTGDPWTIPGAGKKTFWGNYLFFLVKRRRSPFKATLYSILPSACARRH
jgi:hypothetical protein